MRRVSSSILPWIAVVLLGFGLLVSHTASWAIAQDGKKTKQKAAGKLTLEGAWRLVSTKEPRSGQMRKVPPGFEMTKLIVGGRYAWTVVQNGRAIGGAGGQYQVDDSTYTEAVTYVLTDNSQPMVGKSFKFTWKIEDGKWHHRGTLKAGAAAQEIDEIWERIP
jgi:hypothetical protein